MAVGVEEVTFACVGDAEVSEGIDNTVGLDFIFAFREMKKPSSVATTRTDNTINERFFVLMDFLEVQTSAGAYCKRISNPECPNPTRCYGRHRNDCHPRCQ